MRSKIVTIMLVVVAMAVSSVSARAENVMYVQSFKAKVMSAPSFKASVLGEAVKGSKLISLGKTGGWVKVSYAGKEGYVSTLLVSSNPPLVKQGLIRAEDGDISQGVRRRASTFTSAAAARGLAQDDRKRLSTEEEVDYKAVARMESIEVTPAELKKFAEGGRP